MIRLCEHRRNVLPLAGVLLSTERSCVVSAMCELLWHLMWIVEVLNHRPIPILTDNPTPPTRSTKRHRLGDCPLRILSDGRRRPQRSRTLRRQFDLQYCYTRPWQLASTGRAARQLHLALESVRTYRELDVDRILPLQSLRCAALTGRASFIRCLPQPTAAATRVLSAAAAEATQQSMTPRCPLH
jgi:hypothetical protein